MHRCETVEASPARRGNIRCDVQRDAAVRPVHFTELLDGVLLLGESQAR